MILQDTELLLWAWDNGLKPFDPANINPASIDLTWSGRYKLAHQGGWSDMVDSDTLIIRPGELYLLDTTEYITMPPDCAGWLGLKSSVGRIGLEHLHAGFFDPGFCGTATLEVYNLAPWETTITRGQRIVQLVLERMEEAPRRGYGQTGRYNGQRGPQEAR